MFANMVTPEKLVSTWKWVSEGNGIAVIYAKEWIGSNDRLVLPRGLPDDVITKMLWAYQWGHAHGERRGKDFLLGELKHLLEIDQ